MAKLEKYLRLDPSAELKLSVRCCPFCGSIPKLISDPGRGGHDAYDPVAYMRCPICYCCGPLVFSIYSPDYLSLAVDLWNVRKRSPSVEIDVFDRDG